VNTSIKTGKQTDFQADLGDIYDGNPETRLNPQELAEVNKLHVMIIR
jgi:hypothetical protein